MKSIAVTAVLVLAAAGGAVWLVLQPPRPPPPAAEPAPPSADAGVGDGGASAPARGRQRVVREHVSRPPADPAAPHVAHARRLATEGQPLEALEALLQARKQFPEAFADGAHDDLLLELQRAAADFVAGAVHGLAEDDAGRLLARALALVTDLEVRERLREIASDVLRDVVGREQVVLAGAAEGAERDALARHLAHFGPVVPGMDRRPGASGALAERLERLRARHRAREVPAKPLPVADADETEKRRLDQLEKLRQRDAVGLLDHIHSGLAWLALHQAEDGSFTDSATETRCKTLGHESCVWGNNRYDLAGTALATLAFLDFRDQDAQGLFEPTLADAVTYLRRQIRGSGALPRYGYEAGIALMALGQAASSSNDPAVRADLEKAWRYHAALAANGYRYSANQAGDISVTGWFVQAYETARDAGAELPPSLAPTLAGFVRTCWDGEHGFAYTAGSRPRSTLEPVGMLALAILDPVTLEAQRDAWAEHLATVERGRSLNLYTLYYDVRMELALRGELSPDRRAVLDDFAALYQDGTGDGAGRFRAQTDKTLLKAWQGEQRRDPAVSGRDSWIRNGGTTVFTAFSILTLEHALYRR